MYFLKNVTNDSIFYLIKKERFVIGRKNCDFILQNDESISREHAAIYVKNGQVTVEDLGSRYKTVYNGEELTPKSEVPLEVNTEIKFGRFNSLYRLEKMDIITTGTHLNATEKAKLKNILSVVGGTYLDNWTPECTHLTVKAMSVTIKVLHALLDQKPIVVYDYWNNLCQRALNNKLPPDIHDFNKPPITEPLLENISFTNEVCRKFLFKKKTFIFPTEKNKKLMHAVIEKAGGKCISWEANSFPVPKLLQSLSNYLIIQVPNQDESIVFKDLVEAVVKRGKRTIPIQEIALAIIKGSCEKDCNPDFDRVGTVFTKMIPILPTQTGVLVHNTESEVFAIGDIKDVDTSKVVPDTFDPPLEPSLAVKREKQVPQKPSAPSAEPILEDIYGSTKRKCDNESNEKAKKKISIDSLRMCTPSTSKTIQQQEPSKSPENLNKTVQPQENPKSTEKHIKTVQEKPEFPNSSKPKSAIDQSRDVEEDASPSKNSNPFCHFLKRSPTFEDTENSPKHVKLEESDDNQEVVTFEDSENSLKHVKSEESDDNQEVVTFEDTENSPKHVKSEESDDNQEVVAADKFVFKVPLPRNITNVSLPSTSCFDKIMDNMFSSTKQNISISSEETIRQVCKDEPDDEDCIWNQTLRNLESKSMGEIFKERIVIQFIDLDSYIRPNNPDRYVEIVEGDSVKKNFKKFRKASIALTVTLIRTHRISVDFQNVPMIIPENTFHNKASASPDFPETDDDEDPADTDDNEDPADTEDNEDPAVSD